ncbi:hypothetical protein WMF27_41420 [Sorangium sp. So ce281]
MIAADVAPPASSDTLASLTGDVIVLAAAHVGLFVLADERRSAPLDPLVEVALRMHVDLLVAGGIVEAEFVGAGGSW